jgi:hypothetical protein
MKVITLIPRRPDISRAEFKAYYEDKHAPLGTRYFPFDKYVRNHLVAASPEDVGFDVLMECWLDRETAMASLTGEIGAIFTEDEARFMNAPPRPEGFDAIEQTLIGPPRAVDPRGTRKLAWFLKADGIDIPTFLDRAAAWGRSLAAAFQASRAELDSVIPGHVAPLFTGDAVLTLWVDETETLLDLVPPGGIIVQAALLLDSQETTPEELKASFGKR